MTRLVFERETDMPVVMRKLFIALEGDLHEILAGPPKIKKQDFLHIPASITHHIKTAFNRTPPADRAALYRKLSLIFHPDKIKVSGDHLDPKNQFLSKYLKWADQVHDEARRERIGRLMVILKEVEAYYASDLGYVRRYVKPYLSWKEKYHLNLIQLSRYPRFFYTLVRCLLFITLFVLFIVSAVFLVVAPLILLSKVVSLQILDTVTSYFGLQVQYFLGVYIGGHCTVAYILMFGEENYKQALKATISESELTMYYRDQYQSEVDLSEEMPDRVLAYSTEKKMNALRTWESKSRQEREPIFSRSLTQCYDMERYSLLEEYNRQDKAVSHAKLLLSAMTNTVMSSLPTRRIAWISQPSQEKDTVFDNYRYYKKNHSRSHLILNALNDTRGFEFQGLEPWTNQTDLVDTQTIIHVIDNALYQWDARGTSLKKLQYDSPALARLPVHIVRTKDSLFMFRDTNLIRLDLDPPAGISVQPQYIQTEVGLYFYDSDRRVCECVGIGKNESLQRRFPAGAQIDNLSEEDLACIATEMNHYPNRWFVLIFMKAVFVRLLRLLLFIPFLVLDCGVRLLGQFVPKESKLVEYGFFVPYALSSALKCSLDIYDHYQNRDGVVQTHSQP